MTSGDTTTTNMVSLAMLHAKHCGGFKAQVSFGEGPRYMHFVQRNKDRSRHVGGEGENKTFLAGYDRGLLVMRGTDHS